MEYKVNTCSQFSNLKIILVSDFIGKWVLLFLSHLLYVFSRLKLCKVYFYFWAAGPFTDSCVFFFRFYVTMLNVLFFTSCQNNNHSSQNGGRMIGVSLDHRKCRQLKHTHTHTSELTPEWDGASIFLDFKLAPTHSNTWSVLLLYLDSSNVCFFFFLFIYKWEPCAKKFSSWEKNKTKAWP